MADARSKLHAFLVETYRIKAPDLAYDTPLFSSGLLDSFAMLELISFVESMAQVTVRARDVTLENFDCIDRISGYLVRQAL